MQNIVLLVVSIAIVACNTQPSFVSSENSPTGGDLTERIYISNHGYHTGIILPAGKVNLKIPFLHERFGDTQYYEFGWGDAGFYQAEEITLGLALKAILWPTETVMHVVAVSGEPAIYFGSSEVVEIRVSESQLEPLLEFINLSFAKEPGGTITALSQGIYGESQFYKAKGKYFLTNTCNTWTAKGLKSLGMDITISLHLTAESISDYLRKSGNSAKVH